MGRLQTKPRRIATAAACVLLSVSMSAGCGSDESDDPDDVRELAPTTTAERESPASSGMEGDVDDDPSVQGADPGRDGDALDPPGGSTPDVGADDDIDEDGTREGSGGGDDRGVNPDTLGG